MLQATGRFAIVAGPSLDLALPKGRAAAEVVTPDERRGGADFRRGGAPLQGQIVRCSTRFDAIAAVGLQESAHVLGEVLV